MGKYEKLLIKILQDSSDKNIPFEEITNLLVKFGFKERIRGSHHIFIKNNIDEIVNIQSKAGKAKPYQVNK